MLALAALLTLPSLAMVAGCSGDDGAVSPTTAGPGVDETPVDDPLAFAVFTDPAAPVAAAVGQRFALVLDAEPTEGFRWEVVSQVDPALVVALGAQFLPRDDLVVPTTTQPTAGVESSAATSAVQVFSFVGRSAGRTSVTLRYVRVVQSPEAEVPTVTFTIDVAAAA